MNKESIGNSYDMKSNSVRDWTWICLIAALIAGFVTWTYGVLRNETSASWQDTSGYLAHALYIKEHGGIIGFLRECFNGTFPVTERHPLYMLLLLPFASRTEEFFYYAKLVDLAFGVALLASLIWMVTRRYGKGPALIAGAIFSLSNSLVIASSHVNHETQFTLLVLWMWWFLTGSRAAAVASPAGQEATPASLAPGNREVPGSALQWGLAGLCLGLAYLTKSPAILLGMAVLAAGLWHARLRFLVSRQWWTFAAVTLVVSSPLLVRNIVGFGTPLYEGMNSNITWIDDWADMGGDHSSMFYDQYGVMTIEVNGMPTARDYLRTHTVMDIGQRLIKGLHTEVTSVAPKALAFAVPPRGRMATLFGFVVLSCAIAGWWVTRKSWEGALVFFSSGAFLVFFGWDHMFPEIRYLAPLVPVWILLASLVIWAVISRLVRPVAAWRSVAVAASVAVAVGTGWTLTSGSLSRAQPMMEVSPSYARLNDWFNRTIVKGDRVMLGPTREFHGLIWVIDRPISVVLAPDSTSLDGFLKYLHDRKVRYLVMHPENIEGEGGRLKEALSPYFGVSPAGEIIEKMPLPGWSPVHTDEGTPRRFIVYESQALQTS